MIEPTTVWMVHLDKRAHDEFEGTLSGDESGLVFVDTSSELVTRFPYADVVKVKPALGSPVFVLRWKRDDERRETAFYLARPPPLGTLGGQVDPGPPARMGSLRAGKWRQRRDNTRYLAVTYANVKDVRDAWVEEIKRAVDERRDAGS